MTQTPQFYQFSLDFNPVAIVPEDSRRRTSYFKAFQELLKREKNKIQRWHRAGAGGREIVQAHTGLVDETMKHTATSLARTKKHTGSNILSEFALIAVGGYGRGELNPHSDIDLLFILPKKNATTSTDSFIQDFISLLWGIGLEIGHSVRRVKDCTVLAKEDATIQTSMLDMRFLAGEQGLFDELSQSLQTNKALKNIREILKGKLKEQAESNQSVGEWVFSPEPDLKNGPGGLRYYHAALWGVVAYFDSPSFLEMGDAGGLSSNELKSYLRSVGFYLRTRNELHYLSGRKNDVLNRKIQISLARNLGYKKEKDQTAVQRFMRDHFLHATNIYNFSEIIFKRCLKHKQTVIKKMISSLQRKEFENGFFSDDSHLQCEEETGQKMGEKPELLLDAIDLCRTHDLELDAELKRRIRLNADHLNDSFPHQERTREFLLNLLNDSKATKYLRMMHEAGLLGKTLPEFGRTQCLVRYDLYHRFTADEHSLRMVGFLDGLSVTEDADLQELAEIFHSTPQKPMLRLAALLHSLGKDSKNSAGQEHNAAHQLAVIDRLQLTAPDRDTLLFLLSHLNEMTEVALHYEFQHQETIPEFAKQIGTLNRLNLLYLFSYSDLKATAPDTWTTWKKFLLSELYHQTKNHLLQPESLNQKSLSTRFDVFNKLQRDFFIWEIEQHFDWMPREYLQSVPAQEVATHIRLLRSLENEPFVLNIQYNASGSHHSLSLACPRNKEPLKNLVGIVTAKNLNILGAQIFLMHNGVVITTLQVGGKEDIKSETDPIWLEMEHDLHDILEGKRVMRDLLNGRKRYVSAKTATSPIVPKIQIANTNRGEYTVIRVEGQDHLGMLYKIVKILSDFGVQIHHAKIACHGDRGTDVFYTTLPSKKISFKRFIQQIRDRLVQTLLVENVEDMN